MNHTAQWTLRMLGFHGLLFLLTICTVLWWWEIAFDGQEFLYSSPSEIWRVLMNSPEVYWLKARASISRVFFFALPIGVLLGSSLGLFLALFNRSRVLVLLTLALLIPIPRLAINIWMEEVFGGTELMLQVFNAFVATLLSFTICYNGAVSVQGGAQRSQSDVADAAKVYFPTRWQYYWHFLVPMCSKYIFGAAYLSSAFMWPMLIFAEANITDVDAEGIGRMIYIAGEWSLGLEDIFLGTGVLMLCSGLTWLMIFVLQKTLYFIFS